MGSAPLDGLEMGGGWGDVCKEQVGIDGNDVLPLAVEPA